MDHTAILSIQDYATTTL